WKEKGDIREEPYKRETKPLFTMEKFGIKEFMLNVTFIDPYSGTPYHKHVELAETIYVVSGRGEVVIGEEKYQLEPDIVFYVPKEVFHQITNKTAETLKIINVFAPAMYRDEHKKKTIIGVMPKK
ncbi:unnamed protein product, partial [marine sediment metagenome]